MNKNEKILICGILPPPFFGHSKMYEMLMRSDFVDEFDITFLNMRFWTYGQHRKINVEKIIKFFYYYSKFIGLLIFKRPKYILYNISFDKMPFLKDFLFCFTGKILGCRIILHDMGQYLRKLYDDSNKIAKGLIRKLLRITTASIVLGEVTRRTYEGFIEKERTFSVHGSVEDFLELDIGEFPKEQNGRVDVLYFSFLSVSKGLFTALKSIPQVIAQNPNIFFTFCGPIESDSLSEEMERFIKEHHLRSHIRIIGYISDSKKRTQLFRTSDIFIFPTHRDVFGLVLLHAMAEGLPIVASNEGAIPEIVENGRNGYLFKKEDSDALAQKILFLAENPHLREKISKENRKRYLEFYTPQKYGARMVEVFQRITLLI